MIRCFIIDDEPLARRVLRTLVERIPGCSVVGEAASAVDGLGDLREARPDLLFVDIEMPEMSGLELVESLTDPPAVVFTTAHREYAVDGFELDALDYLVKPIALPRLIKTIERYRAQPSSRMEATFDVRADRRTYRLDIHDIRFIESIRDYIKIHTSDDSVLAKRSLTETETELAPHGFVRIHRSYLINSRHVSAFSGEDVQLGSTTLPVGPTYRDTVIDTLSSDTRS